MNPKAEALWQELVINLRQFLSSSFPGTELGEELLATILGDGPAFDFYTAVAKAYMCGAMDGSAIASRIALGHFAQESKHVLADQD